MNKKSPPKATLSTKRTLEFSLSLECDLLIQHPGNQLQKCTVPTVFLIPLLQTESTVKILELV